MWERGGEEGAELTQVEPLKAEVGEGNYRENNPTLLNIFTLEHLNWTKFRLLSSASSSIFCTLFYNILRYSVVIINCILMIRLCRL